MGTDDITVIEVQPARREFAAGLEFAVASPGEIRHFPRVIDASGTAGGLTTALASCRDGGTVVLLGLSGNESTPADTDAIVLRDLTVRGSLGSPGVWPEVIELVADGRVRPSVLVSHEFPLSETAAAFATARAGNPGVRKVLVRPTWGSGMPSATYMLQSDDLSAAMTLVAYSRVMRRA